MLWSVRTTLVDRPGALAALTRLCGDRGVNILGLQIFPGVTGVTDELVLRAPDDWSADAVDALVVDAGGARVAVSPCTEHALVDPPIQYLHALRRVAHDSTLAEPLLTRLLGADPAAAGAGHPDRAGGGIDVQVGSHRLTLRRSTPFTATERARAVAFAEVATDLVDRSGAPDGSDGYPTTPGPTPGSAPRPVVRMATVDDMVALVRMHRRCSAESVHRRYAYPPTRADDRFVHRLLASGDGTLVAAVATPSAVEVVGVASVAHTVEGVAEVSLLVEDGWQRRGVGGRLLHAAARLARTHGAREVSVRSQGANPGLTALAFASGLRARLRLEGETVVVTIGVEGLAPLVSVPTGTRVE